MSPRVRRAVLHVGWMIVAIVAMVAAAGALTAMAYDNKVLPRTIVGGQTVSGLTYTNATQVIAAGANTLQQSQLALHFQDKDSLISLQDLGVTISGDQTAQRLIRPKTNWDWLSYHYWYDFFRPKHLAYSYSLNDSLLEAQLQQLFGVSLQPTDGSIKVDNGQLVVEPSQDGQDVDANAVRQAIDQLASNRTAPNLNLTAVTTKPLITTAQASQTKTDIQTSLAPIYLVSSNNKFTIPANDLFGLLNFSTDGNQLKWEISKDKLHAYLDTKIAKKLNIAMVQKVTQADTGQVTSDGKDGQAVQLDQLTTAVYQAITTKTDTNTSPIPIQINPVPFTEKTIYPDYVAGLFPGLYVDISLAKQTMYIMNNTTVTATYLVSTGKHGLPTPTGLFYIKNKIEIARSPLYKSLWMRKWNGLARNPDGSGYQGYGIHDLPCFDSGCHSIESAAHLGQPVSHGCVRLNSDNAAWFYDNIPIGTPVNIH